MVSVQCCMDHLLEARQFPLDDCSRNHSNTCSLLIDVQSIPRIGKKRPEDGDYLSVKLESKFRGGTT